MNACRKGSLLTQSPLKLLSSYPLPKNMFASLKHDTVDILRNAARFGKTLRYINMMPSSLLHRMPLFWGRVLPSNAVRIRLDINTYQEYQKNLDALLKALHETVENLQDILIYGQICLLVPALDRVLIAVVLIAELRDFKLFSSPKKP